MIYNRNIWILTLFFSTRKCHESYSILVTSPSSSDITFFELLFSIFCSVKQQVSGSHCNYKLLFDWISFCINVKHSIIIDWHTVTWVVLCFCYQIRDRLLIQARNGAMYIPPPSLAVPDWFQSTSIFLSPTVTAPTRRLDRQYLLNHD